MGIQTSLDALRAAEHIVDAVHLADELAFEASRDPGTRTVRVLRGALEDGDQLVAIAAVHALGAAADEEASRAVAALLSDPRPFLREHAAWVVGGGLPRPEAVARLVAMTADGGFAGMLAQRSLEQWAAHAPEPVAVGLESALVGVREPAARARLVETLGLVAHPLAVRPLLVVADDPAEDEVARVAAVAALGERPGVPAVLALLDRLAAAPGHLGDVARLALLDTAPPPVHAGDGDGLTVGQLFLHADVDARLTAAGAGDNGGIATLLVRLGDALVAPSATPVRRVVTMSRGSAVEARADLAGLGGDGHVYGRVPLLHDPVPSPSAWPLRVAARRGIRRVVRAAGVDVLHLRMADVGSLAAADVARALDIPVVFTVAPDPHAVIHSLDLAGTLRRDNLGDVDAVEHFWFRARLVQRLAANAAHTVLFPRPALRRDMRRLVGIDIAARPERHTVVPEGVDLGVVERAVGEAVAHAGGAAPTPALAELRDLVGGLAPERRGLPLVVSVGRLHRVKGMATLVEAWAGSDLRGRANLLVVGGDVADPSADEREQLDRIAAVVPPGERAAAGLLVPGHRPNDVVARWVAAVRTGLPGLVAPQGVYACASLKEEFGIALLEAMASGLVVVAPDGGGPATYVVEGVTGFLTATWDRDRLAAAVGAALTASTAETDGRRAARSLRTVQRSFTVERMALALADVYGGVVDEERAGRLAAGATA
ncbi:glycosyltransferase [Cellulomonas endophytica]|uniref:glycosyltransferase n=1 Tax=Cellulomonas endophytica TaxID=2494735 RepID=UPI001010ED95|nr:glycosyltransferase [Cellulomonas endophytica]